MTAVASGFATSIRDQPTTPFSKHTRTPSTSNTTHRLLYRGSLSLPDSHLVLDGLAFLLTQPPVLSNNLNSPRHGIAILENPLALALESMRGRPNLKFGGVVKVKESWIDVGTGGEVVMYIHPESLLTRIYFDNLFCLLPTLSPDGRTEYGLRVRLGDDLESEGNNTNAADKSEILIYGQLCSSLHSADSLPSSEGSGAPNSQKLTIRVSRILPHPPSALKPPRPRPDDPTPRVPPLFLPKRPLLSLGGVEEGSKRAKKRKLVGGVNSAVDNECGVFDDTPDGSEAFKVPRVPDRTKGKGKEMALVDAIDDQETSGDVEKVNKLTIKSATVAFLSTKGVDKGHEEFKEVFGWTYRGVGFALRSMSTTQTIEHGPSIAALPVELHGAILLYLPFPDLLSAYWVCSLWRTVIPHITDPHRQHLLNVAFKPHQHDPYPQPINLSVRNAYVEYIETKHRIEIPYEYRLVLTEWPFAHPPPRMTWPDALRFFADPDKGCSCDRRPRRHRFRRYWDFNCSCQDREVSRRWVEASNRLLDKIFEGEEFDLFDDNWDLTFDLPSGRYLSIDDTKRLIELIKSYPYSTTSGPWHDERYGDGPWDRRMTCSRLGPLALDLSALLVDDSNPMGVGYHLGRTYMILEGKARGQIHAWSEYQDYDGFIAESFFEWKDGEMGDDARQILNGIR
ncbi:hypothetical protein JAAARDRAFT_195069 [Jaapia argillacea MUCL 33604]|uniref:F-box domain-containing protein n=1 Tax=Jaapia argillacea MUCL 33604 TaxID=933084 RepID=A0A067PYV8_9AGAM|nr:hypothetical protein JAAARDRAFT_195069 [Jaapia argillacea MUCL 33604]